MLNEVNLSILEGQEEKEITLPHKETSQENKY